MDVKNRDILSFVTIFIILALSLLLSLKYFTNFIILRYFIVSTFLLGDDITGESMYMCMNVYADRPLLSHDVNTRKILLSGRWF